MKFPKYVAEAVATFALVFCGTAAIAANEASRGAVTPVGISLVFGLVVLAMIYSVGHVSGAHMNPAVSLAFATVRRLPARELPFYWTAQAAGAFLASAVVRLVFPASRSLGMTLPSGPAAQSFVLELVMTLLLMFVIMGVAQDERAEGEMAGIAIGSTIALEALLGGPISGASMNPIRSLAPAVVAGNLRSVWIYLTAPSIGAVAGAFLHNAVRCGRAPSPAKAGCC
ncbi:MAG: aquaporin [Elusimicrobia bacterium]|nr:aquaporin [Elusimicrobiota bacterium]